MQRITKSRLLNRKLDSRDTIDSSLCSLRRCDLFLKKKKQKTTKVITRNQANQSPMEDCAKACTELMIPLRVRKVPRMASQNVAKTSHMFHIFSMPRFSCIITECKKAVPRSEERRVGKECRSRW